MRCPLLHMSPDGGSTLITSAPKSERMTAAPGAATKLERSTTLRPEKMLSVAFGIGCSFGFESGGVQRGCAENKDGPTAGQEDRVGTADRRSSLLRALGVAAVPCASILTRTWSTQRSRVSRTSALQVSLSISWRAPG